MTSTRLPTLMIPHGGGPCFFMDGPPGMPAMWDAMAAHLRGLAAEVGARPKAVLVVSGHWETEIPTVLAAGEHTLLYDYYGFPEHTYRLTYPAKGAPEIAARTRALLEAANIPTAVETERGLDHGVFVPFKLIYPGADVPIVQMSLRADLSPRRHLEIGRALAPLRDEGVLIVGSGMTFHNMGAMRGPGSDHTVQASETFDTWLTETVEMVDPRARTERLAAWDQAPGARFAHPREEHLLPIMVAAGAAGDDPGRCVYAERLGGLVAQSGYRFG
jgi:aromatic ring-opening dioxygenase catalytic subunit (LigB family)